MCNIHFCDPSALRHHPIKPSIGMSVNIPIGVHSQNCMNQLVLHHFPCSFFSACNFLYICSILFAPFKATELCKPHSPQINPCESRFPSAPHAEQILPVPLEEISTRVMPFVWHFCKSLLLTYPCGLSACFLFACLYPGFFLWIVTGFVITIVPGFSVSSIRLIPALI